jgi:hypothetical protein
MSQRASRADRKQPSRPLFQDLAPESAFLEWFKSQAATEGIDINQRFLYSFTVNEEGMVTNAGNKGMTDSVLFRQVERILERSPVWTPARLKRKEFNTSYFLVRKSPEDSLRVVHRQDADIVEPKFNGDLADWLDANLNYPENALAVSIKGRVVVRFFVDREGYSQVDELISSPHVLLTTEATRLIIAMPRWEPGTVEGFLVNYSFVLPFDFRVHESRKIRRTQLTPLQYLWQE